MKSACVILSVLLSVATTVHGDNPVSITLTATGTMSNSIIDDALTTASSSKTTVTEIKLLSASPDACWNLADCQVISNYLTATAAPALAKLDLSAAAFANRQTPPHTATGGGAFNNMGFSAVILPNDLETLGDRTFINCKKLTDITWPANLTVISAAAFASCSALDLTALPESITAIHNHVFQSCSKLALTALPPALKGFIGRTLAGKSTFAGTAVEISRLPEGVTGLGQNTFQNCQKIRSMTFPKGFAQIGALAFSGASGLTTLIFEGENAPYVENTNAFSSPGLIDVIVPYGTPLDGASSWKQGIWTSFKSVTMANPPSSLDRINSDGKNIRLYPAIANTEIFLTGIEHPQTVGIYNITGQKTLEFEAAANSENRIPIARLAPGIYLLKAENAILKFIRK
jgi:hypothetical protein